MPQDILFVEDDNRLLTQYGHAVELALGIQPFLAESGDKAIEILRSFPVKVVVTDQRMPAMSGTELARRVRHELGLDIPFIMVTGYSHLVEASDAVNLSFSRFIDKRDVVSELIPAIRQALDSHLSRQLAASRQIVNIPLASPRSAIFPLRRRVRLLLRAILNVVDDYAPPDEWRLECTAQRGISTEQRLDVSRMARFKYETTTQASLLGRTGFSVGALIPAVTAQLGGTFSTSVGTSYECEYQLHTAQTLTIHQITDPPDINGISLLSREYLTCPLYKQVNCLMELQCGLCGIPHQLYVALNFPIGKLALRHKENHSDGQTKVVDAGFLSAELAEKPLPR